MRDNRITRFVKVLGIIVLFCIAISLGSWKWCNTPNGGLCLSMTQMETWAEHSLFFWLHLLIFLALSLFAIYAILKKDS